MRRNLRVNAGHEDATDWEAAWRRITGGEESFECESADELTRTQHAKHPVATGGKCLYLGPRGQRCDRPALEGGFCAHHGADAKEATNPRHGRIVAAILALLALIWPVLSDIVHFIFGWIHRH